MPRASSDTCASTGSSSPGTPPQLPCARGPLKPSPRTQANPYGFLSGLDHQERRYKHSERPPMLGGGRSPPHCGRLSLPGNGTAWGFTVSEGDLNTHGREISRIGEIMRPEYGASRRRCRPVSGNGHGLCMGEYQRECGGPEPGQQARPHAADHLLCRLARPGWRAAITCQTGRRSGSPSVTEGAARQTRCSPAGRPGARPGWSSKRARTNVLSCRAPAQSACSRSLICCTAYLICR
jgi:hypothetical protein